MSSENLARIGQLRPHTPSAEEILRLLVAAQRNFRDAEASVISDEARLALGYTAIMQCAAIGLAANGYRTPTNVPGHHQTMIQNLSLTLGIPHDEWQVLDALRKKRNLNDYLGELIDPVSLEDCLARARRLMEHTRTWLHAKHPELMQA